MRWEDPDAKHWTPLFDEGADKDRITIEKGEYDVYRVRYWREGTEALIHFRAGNAEELAQILANEDLFTKEEALRIAERLANPQ